MFDNNYHCPSILCASTQTVLRFQKCKCTSLDHKLRKFTIVFIEFIHWQKHNFWNRRSFQGHLTFQEINHWSFNVVKPVPCRLLLQCPHFTIFLLPCAVKNFNGVEIWEKHQRGFEDNNADARVTIRKSWSYSVIYNATTSSNIREKPKFRKPNSHFWPFVKPTVWLNGRK